MEEHVIRFYDYDELSEAARKSAIENMSKIQESSDHFWYNSDLTYEFEQTLKDNGLDKCECYWSLSCSQGDGVAFYGHVDIGDFIRAKEDRAKFIPLVCFNNYPLFSCKIENISAHYNHYNTMRVEWEDNDDDDSRHGLTLFKSLVDEFKGYFEDFIKSLSRQMEKEGYDFLDYYSSEEFFIEELRNNETFKITKSGAVFKEYELPDFFEEEDNGDAVGSAAEPAESAAV